MRGLDLSLSSRSADTLGQLHWAMLRHRQWLHLARLAIRLDRYRTEYGSLPDQLDIVLDAEFTELPVCLFSATPVIYQADRSMFEVFNLGRNATEDEVRPDAGLRRRYDINEISILVRYPDGAAKEVTKDE